jgi:uncharacterized protein
MTIPSTADETMPVVTSVEHFDRRSGNMLERLIFNNRAFLVVLCLIITAVLGFQVARLQINASFDKMMPTSHPFIKNYRSNAASLRGLGNSVRIVVEDAQPGSSGIYDPRYLATLRELNDAVFLVPGVDRSLMKSLWMPAVRWTEITEEGYKGGAFMPDDYDGKKKSIDALRHNVMRAGIVGSLVANDLKSSMIFVPMVDIDAATGTALDYGEFRNKLDEIRVKFEKQGVRVHIIGFPELVGDLIHGLRQVFAYFLVAAFIATMIIFIYTRCPRSTVAVTVCSIIAVIWQLGIVRLLGYPIDPYSVLVPFLIFAIGVSHGAQKMNGIMQDIGRGTNRYVAARYTFRRLFLAGLTALLADAVGFAVLMLVDIPVIRALALEASIGVAVLIFTNLILLPLLLSYSGVSKSAAARAAQSSRGDHPMVRVFARFTNRGPAMVVLLATAILTAGGAYISRGLQIGDLDSGAPELRPDSRYNLDNAYVTSHYGLSSDQFAVIVKTAPNGVVDFQTLLEMDRLEQMLRDLPQVQTTVSAASLARDYTAAGFEGSFKWVTINRDPFVIGDAINNVYSANPEILNEGKDVAPIIAFLTDHKAATLASVVRVVQAFSKAHDTPERKFLLAAGNGGIEAATNVAVAEANHTMLIYVYASVVVLCYITFRSWRAVVVAVVPLVVTSVLAEALMVLLGIGVKVATLPVIALGVGIGVDYSLYLLTVHLAHQRRGQTVKEAYTQALTFTGKVVALIGITLAAAVITWAWSPIKFQADMGILLAFMFLWNMLGALVMVPALATFLLTPRSLRSRRGKAELASA